MTDIENYWDRRAKALDDLNTILERQENPENWDHESDHIKADGILLNLIHDQEINDAFYAIEKWYS